MSNGTSGSGAGGVTTGSVPSPTHFTGGAGRGGVLGGGMVAVAVAAVAGVVVVVGV